MIGFKNIKNSSNSSAILSKISLTDYNGTVFSNLETAQLYVKQFTNAELTDISFENKTFYFTVPANTSFAENSGFCGKLTSGEDLQFIDNSGLVTAFKEKAFEENSQSNVFQNAVFEQGSFNSATGSNSFNTCVFNGTCFENYKGIASFKNGNTFGVSSFNDADGCTLYFGNNNQFGYLSFQNATNVTATFENNNQFGAASISLTSKCTFSFLNANEFDATSFTLTSESNYKFGIDNIFGSNAIDGFCFDASTKTTATFENNNIFYSESFRLASDCYFEINGTNTFSDNVFYQASSNIKINTASFGDKAFFEANYTKTTIEKLVSCGADFCKDFTGRFEILNSIGPTALQTLPGDVFTTNNIVDFRYNNLLNYNNAGGKDGDLVKILENITNTNSFKLICGAKSDFTTYLGLDSFVKRIVADTVPVFTVGVGEQILKTYTFPANTFKTFMSMPLISIPKTGINGSAQIKIRISNINDYATATQCYQNQLSGSNISTISDREFFFYNGNIYVSIPNSSLNSDKAVSNVLKTPILLDKTSIIYMWITGVCFAAGDTIGINGVQING
jgi:hypothetical protein